MDGLDIAQFVQRALKERRAMILDVLQNNGVRDMEHYQFCMGELNAMNQIGAELSDLLERQEHIND